MDQLLRTLAEHMGPDAVALIVTTPGGTRFAIAVSNPQVLEDLAQQGMKIEKATAMPPPGGVETSGKEDHGTQLYPVNQ